jgi:hypothetical protein
LLIGRFLFLPIILRYGAHCYLQVGGAFIFTIIEHALARRPWHSSVTHHDALEFPDGHVVLLTLCVGQRATVLQLPAAARPEPRENQATPEVCEPALSS